MLFVGGCGSCSSLFSLSLSLSCSLRLPPCLPPYYFLSSPTLPYPTHLSTIMLAASAPITSDLISSTSSMAAGCGVTTRVVTVHRPLKPLTGALKITARPATPIDPPSSPASTSSKRPAETIDSLATRPAKKQRLQSASSKSATRSPSVSSDHSRASSYTPSRHSSLATTQLYTTRSTSRATSACSGSRSASVLPSAEPLPPRECWITEDGRPGPGLLSSECVVRDLMRSYKACACHSQFFSPSSS